MKIPNKKIVVKLILLSGLSLLSSGKGNAAPPTGIKAVPFYDQTKIDWPDAKLAWMGEVRGLKDCFYVLDLRGKIYSLYPGNGDYVKKLIADFSANVNFDMGGEKGAFSMSFHPNFIQNKKFYLAYYRHKKNGDAQNGALAIEEWKASGINSDSIVKVKTIFDLPNTGGFTTSCLNFGPDGFLYISNSDYGHSGQDLKSLRRKLLRIDIDKEENGKPYAIPSSNPFAASVDTGIKKEIYAFGFRNPWRFTIDPLNGDIWLGDVGQVENEEINLVKNGDLVLKINLGILASEKIGNTARMINGSRSNPSSKNGAALYIETEK